jgi:SAM-dependent methyltransferase
MSGRCAACGGELERCFQHLAQDYLTGDPFELWSCRQCGTGATVPVPADLGRYYPSGYRAYHAVVLAVLGFLYRRRVGRWDRLFAAPGTGFELGCGSGLMLDQLRRLGWQVSGSERNEAAAAAARARYGLDISGGGLETLDPAARFDLILLNQVLEHLEHPAETIAALGRRLEPGGRLVIGVPNFGSWQSAIGGARWFHLDPPRHLHHFTRAGLEQLLAGAGLAVERISFVSFEHDPYGWIQTVLNLADRRSNRLTRLLMRLDRPDGWNLSHLALGGLIGVVAVPLALVSWVARRGALIEIVARRG